jgi:putative hydrolase of the HAD superfamily
MKGVIFDFWGTLVENGTYSPMKQTYKILNVRLPFSVFVEKFERIFMTKKHSSKAEAFKEVCKEFNVTPNNFVIDKLVGLWNKNMLLAEPYDDVVDVLEELKKRGLKIILLCNASENNVEPVLEKFDLRRLFDLVFLSFEEGLLKNDKLFYEKALKKLKLNKKDVIVVGDSVQSDIKGAENAGLKGVLIDRKNSRDYPDKILTLFDLLEVV